MRALYLALAALLWAGVAGAQTVTVVPGAASSQLYSQGFRAGTIAPPSPMLPKSGIVPSRHLAKFQASGTPTVCFVGDSTTSLGDYVNSFDGLAQKIRRALRVAYPDKTITFVDRSIGGTNLSSVSLTGTAIAATGASLPSWFVTAGNTWNSYVSAAGCTTLFVNFGVNDTGYQSGQIYQTFMTNVAAYATVPDLIYITNVAANPSAGAPFNDPSYQAGYLANAALQRTLVESGINLGATGITPPGLIDVGRLFFMSVQGWGYDPAVQSLSWSVYPAAPVTGITSVNPYTFPTTPGGDFSYSVTFTNGSGFIGAGPITFYYAGSRGTTASGAGNTYLLINPNSGTNAYVQVYPGNSTLLVNVNLNNWSAGSNTIAVTAIGGRLIVTVNGTQAWDVLLPRPVTGFAPTITANPTGGTTMTVNSYAIGTPQPYSPIISAANCYGSLTGANSGNGVNHDSSLCLNWVYQRAVDQTTWRADRSIITTSPAISACGTAPALLTGSTDLRGSLTIGTGTPSACSLTFGTTFATSPYCVANISSSGAPLTVASTAISTSSVTFTASGVVAGGLLTYQCAQ